MMKVRRPHWGRSLTALGLGAAFAIAPLTGSAGAQGLTGATSLDQAVVADTPAAMPAQTLQNAPGRENLMACFQSSREARLLLLVDESGSLDDADPEDGRVLAAEYAVNDLSRRAAQKDATFRIAVRGFADVFEENDTWLTLPEDRQRAVDLVRSFADRTDGRGTDYWMALNGARAALTEADPTGSECQALIWFSDGELDPTPTFESEEGRVVKPYLGAQGDVNREQAAEKARLDLCRDGGVADQVRSAGVTTFGIALASGGLTREDFATMEAITTGTSEGGTTCGGRLDPVPGDFFFTGGSDGLLSAFDSIFALDEVQTDYPPTDICQGDPTACAGTVFVLDGSIQDVHIFATSEVVTPQVTLVPPGGEPVAVPWGKDNETSELAVGGGALTVTGLTDNSIALDMSATGQEPWTGAWAIKFVDPTAASEGKQVNARISISGGLVPVASILGDGGEADTVRRGDEASITLGIENRTGEVVAPESLLGSVEMDVGLVTADGVVIPVKDNVSKGEVGTPLSVDLSDAEVGDAQVRLKLRVVTAPTTVGDTEIEGTALAEAVNNVPFRLLLAADYPVIGSFVDLGSTEAQTSLPGSLSVTGSGCVWLDPGTAAFSALPGDVGTPRLVSEHTSAETCFVAQAGSEGTIPLELALDQTGNGGISGTFTAFVAPEGETTRAEAVEVRLGGSVARPANTVWGLVAFVIALATGILIPLGLLYFAKWRGSAIPARALFYEEIPVHVTDDQVLRDGGAFGFRSGDLRAMVSIPPKGGRSLTVGDATLKATIGASPLGVGVTSVSVPGAQVVTSTDTTSDKQGRGRLPLAIHNTWTAWTSSAGTKVLLLVGADASESERRELYADVAQRLPRALEHVDPSFRPSDQAAKVSAGVAVGGLGGATSATGDDWSAWDGESGAGATAAGGPATQADDWGGWGDDGAPSAQASSPEPPTEPGVPDTPSAPGATPTPDRRPDVPVAPDEDWGTWDDD